MPIQQLAPPTFDEISQELARFEKRFGISTTEFLAAERRPSLMDEDDAVEWHYLAEQLKAIKEAVAARPYSHATIGKPLKNSHCVMDRLAA